MTAFYYINLEKDIILYYHMDKSEVVGLSGLSEYQSRQLEKILGSLHGVDLSRDEIKVLIWLARLSGCIFGGSAPKSAFALLSSKVTKHISPQPSPGGSTLAGIYFGTVVCAD